MKAGLRILGMLLIFAPASVMILAAILWVCACWNDPYFRAALFVTLALWGCLLLGNWCLYKADKKDRGTEPKPTEKVTSGPTCPQSNYHTEHCIVRPREDSDYECACGCIFRWYSTANWEILIDGQAFTEAAGLPLQLDSIREDLEALETLEATGNKYYTSVDGSIEHVIPKGIEPGIAWRRAKEAANRMPEHVRMLLRAIGRADVIPGEGDGGQASK